MAETSRLNSRSTWSSRTACSTSRHAVLVVGVDRVGAEAHALGGGDLVAHEGQQGADQQRGSEAGIAQELGGDEVDEALASAGLLHEEEAAVAAHDVADRLLLAGPELGGRIGHAGAEQLQGAGGGERHRRDAGIETHPGAIPIARAWHPAGGGHRVDAAADHA